jgi:hypothetical protein
MGKIRWERKKTVKTVEDGEVVARRPVAEEYLIFEGKHPAIIDAELWEAVQARRGTMPRNKKAGNFANIFAGLLFCECGCTLRRHAFVKRGKEYAQPRLQCAQPKMCKNASCTVAEIVDLVKATLREAIDDFEIRIEAGTDNSADVHRQLVERLERRLAELQTLEVKQWETYTLEGMPKHIFDQLNAKVLAEKEEVQHALATAKDAHPEPVDFEAKATTFRAALEMLEDPNAPAKELNMLLKACIERMEYRRPRSDIQKHKRWATGAPIELDVTLRV